MLSREIETMADQVFGRRVAELPIGPAEMAEIEACLRDYAERAAWLEALAVRPEGQASADPVDGLREIAIRAAARGMAGRR